MSHNSTRLYLLTKPGEKENVSSFTFSGQQQWLSCLQYARCCLQHLQYISLFQMGGSYLSLMYFSYFLATWSLAHFKPRASTHLISFWTEIHYYSKLGLFYFWIKSWSVILFPAQASVSKTHRGTRLRVQPSEFKRKVTEKRNVLFWKDDINNLQCITKMNLSFQNDRLWLLIFLANSRHTMARTSMTWQQQQQKSSICLTDLFWAPNPCSLSSFADKVLKAALQKLWLLTAHLNLLNHYIGENASACM